MTYIIMEKTYIANIFPRTDGNPSHDKVGYEHHKDGQRSHKPDKEIYDTENPAVGLESTTIGELVADIGPAHAPSDKNDYQQRPERHEPIGGELVEEIEQGVAE